MPPSGGLYRWRALTSCCCSTWSALLGWSAPFFVVVLIDEEEAFCQCFSSSNSIKRLDIFLSSTEKRDIEVLVWYGNRVTNHQAHSSVQFGNLLCMPQSKKPQLNVVELSCQHCGHLFLDFVTSHYRLGKDHLVLVLVVCKSLQRST